jgi:hypothetical protein
MTQTQDEQNVQTPVTPAQDTSAEAPVTETTAQQTAPEQPVAENNVAPATQDSNNENPGFQTD